MRSHGRKWSVVRSSRLWLAVALAAVLAVFAVVGSFASEPTIESAGNGYGSYHWQPSTAEVSSGGAVTFKNGTPSVPHGIVWESPPETPICTGVPVNEGKENWEGKCKFTKAGTYSFHCYVHPYMKGTITVKNLGEPVVTTGVATAGRTKATLNGTIDPEGKATEYFFEWGESESYGHKTIKVKLSAEDKLAHSVSEELPSLKAGTTYHFRLVAENAAGTVPGGDRQFTTEFEPGAPSTTTGSASVQGETAATLGGTVDPDGLATDYFFEWGTSTSYGQKTPEQSLGSEDHAGHSVSAQLTGLAAGTTYHFRLVAKNTMGTVPGVDKEFTTTSPPPPPPSTTPTPTTTPTPSPTTTQPPAPVPPVSSSPPASPETPSGSPFVGAPTLRSTQRGTSVGGSLEVSAAGAGGRLEIDLFAKGASLAGAKHSASVRVGRLLRSSVSAGRVAFVVKLDAAARRALGRLRHLALTVKVTLTPPRSRAVTVTHTVQVRLR